MLNKKMIVLLIVLLGVLIYFLSQIILPKEFSLEKFCQENDFVCSREGNNLIVECHGVKINTVINSDVENLVKSNKEYCDSLEGSELSVDRGAPAGEGGIGE